MNLSFLDDYKQQIYALLRIFSGFTFGLYGTVKLFNFPKVFAYDLTPLMYVAGTIEAVGGLLILLGLCTRYAAFICSGTMAVAYWMAHGMQSFFPMNNGGELAVLYCFLFLYIAANGAGIWSLDSRKS